MQFTGCDVVNCDKIATNLCEVCNNPLCLRHTTIQRDVHRNYSSITNGGVTASLSATTIEKRGLCPDCHWIYSVAYPVPRNLCCVRFGKVYMIISAALFIVGIIIVATGMENAGAVAGFGFLGVIISVGMYSSNKRSLSTYNNNVEAARGHQRVMKRDNGLQCSKYNYARIEPPKELCF